MSSNPYLLEPASRSTFDGELFPHIGMLRPDFGASSEGTQSRDLHEYWDIIRKRKTLIAVCTGLTALAAFLYCLFTPPTYNAKTTIELRGHQPLLATSQSETLFGSDTRKIEYQKTTVAKLTLTGLADEVLSSDGLAVDLNHYWRSSKSVLNQTWDSFLRLFTGPAKSDVASASEGTYFMHSPGEIRRYLSLISIEPVHETNLVNITASTSDPYLSQRLANTHAVRFIDHLRKERQESIRTNVELLQAQAQELKTRMNQAETQIDAYAAQHKLLAVRGDENATLNNRHIEQLAQLLADATGRRIRSESRYNEAKRKKEDEGSASDNEITKQLRISLQQAEAEYATLGSQVTSAFPGMRELQAKITSFRKSIRDERSRTIVGLQSEFESDRVTEQNLKQQIEQEKASAQDVAKKLIQYNVLSKEVASLRDLYQLVLKQAQEIEMSASATTSNVFVADYAGLPTSPSAPKTNIIVIVFSCMGLTAGILLAFILESLEDTIASSEQAQQTLDLPIIGLIPDFDNDNSRSTKRIAYERDRLTVPDSPRNESNPENSDTPSAQPEAPPAQSSDIVTVSSPHSAISEALRTIRANLLLSSADYPPRVVAISSAIQNEGKTTVAANLAVTLAQANHRTLLLDGDLRLSGLTKLFSSRFEPGAKGLTDFLTGQRDLEHIIYPTQVPHLDIMPAGSKAPNPAELVGSASMKKLLSSLKQTYDFILLDTPPIMAVSDGLLLSRFVDSVLFVVRHGHTSRSVAREARQKLSHVRARIIGVVLNEVPASTHHRDSMQYGANYLYGE